MLTTLKETLRNLLDSPLQSFLSILGVIIGVAALTAMLSMIDGLENYAQEQVAARGDMKSILARPIEGRLIDGVYTPYDTTVAMTDELVAELVDSLPHPVRTQLQMTGRNLGYTAAGERIGIYYTATTLPLLGERELLAGEELTKTGGDSRNVIINESLAVRLLPPNAPPEDAVGLRFSLLGDSLRAVGVAAKDEKSYGVEMTLTTFYDLPEMDPGLITLVTAVEQDEHVAPTEEKLKQFFKNRFPEMEETVDVYSRSNMLADIAEGVLIFRLVMGFLIGIAVVVGGVGVMNVLLMSISERTPEIGIRKAVGATRGGIIRQFMAEAIIISVVGSLIGVLLGLAVSFTAAPVLNYFVDDLDFRAGFSLTTLAIISVIAVAIGVVFGTYPARKAAGLDPVEAIRR
ncbi:ABC transporter permease [Lewinella sp. 4G2]|uniref:ABC transporter permease n=1 Tax=Lewinella sp. 4G2 TaxID=1803372 RepID=UPI0007B4CF7A|nr:ABC transporter permease [Lewinella sp. 4G2]OAV42951.1 hypothetical protein A3850_017160 [Lewinella sp. 4G2]